MPKRRSKATSPDVETETANAINSANNEPPIVEAGGSAETETRKPDGPESQDIARRGQFRSWVVDAGLGYTRLTDVDNHCIVLQFEQKPPPDLLAAVKGAGFQFRPDHHGQKNCWVRANNFEGRQQVERIETLIGVAVEGRASAVR